MPLFAMPESRGSRPEVRWVSPVWLRLNSAYRIDPLLARTVTTERPGDSGVTVIPKGYVPADGRRMMQVRGRWLSLPG